MKTAIPILYLLFSYHCRAQEKVPELVTDRPDKTESSSIIPMRMLQIKTGSMMEHEKMMDVTYSTSTFNTTLLRYGLLNRIELRLGLDYLGNKTRWIQSDSTGQTNGFSPLYTGFKIRITDEKGWRPSVAFLGSVVLPFTAGTSFSTSYPAPGMAFAFSHTLSERISPGYNLGVRWDGKTALPGYYYTVSMGIGISDKVGAFLENYGEWPEEETSRYYSDAGITWLLLPTLQFDLSGGIGLSNTSYHFLSTGITYRTPK